jgi:hypothetical protein
MLSMPKITERSNSTPEQYYAFCEQSNVIANYIVIVGTMGGQRESRKHKNTLGGTFYVVGGNRKRFLMWGIEHRTCKKTCSTLCLHVSSLVQGPC